MSDFVEYVKLQNVKVMCLSPNITSLIQTLECGVIASLQFRYRRLHVVCTFDLRDLCSEDIYIIDVLQTIGNTLIGCTFHYGPLNTSRVTLIYFQEFVNWIAR